MVYPEIKIKEKGKSFNLKMKISKKEVNGVVLNPDEVIELKRTILEEISYEVDNLIEMMIEDEELNEEQLESFQNSLDKVQVSIEEVEVEEVSEQN
jgi:hypothetical protein